MIRFNCMMSAKRTVICRRDLGPATASSCSGSAEAGLSVPAAGFGDAGDAIRLEEDEHNKLLQRAPASCLSY